MSQTLPKSNAPAKDQSSNIASYSSTSGSHIIPVLIPSRNIGPAQVFQSPHTPTISVQGPAILLSTNAVTSPMQVSDAPQVYSTYSAKTTQSLAVRVVTSNAPHQSHILTKQRIHSKIPTHTNVNSPSGSMTQIVSSNSQKVVHNNVSMQEPAILPTSQKVLIHKPQISINQLGHASGEGMINLQSVIPVTCLQSNTGISSNLLFLNKNLGEQLAAKPGTTQSCIVTNNPVQNNSGAQRNNTLTTTIPASTNYVKQHGTATVLSGVLYTASTPISTNASNSGSGMLVNSLNVVTMTSSVNPITNGTKTSSSGVNVTPNLSGFGKATVLRGVTLNQNIASNMNASGQLSNRKRSRKQLLATTQVAHQTSSVTPVPSSNVNTNNVIVMAPQPDRTSTNPSEMSSIANLTDKECTPKPNILNITALPHGSANNNPTGTIIGHALTCQTNTTISSPISPGSQVSGTGGLVGIRLLSMRSNVCPPPILTSSMTPTTTLSGLSNSVSPKPIVHSVTQTLTNNLTSITRTLTDAASSSLTSNETITSVIATPGQLNLKPTSNSSTPVYVLPQTTLHSVPVSSTIVSCSNTNYQGPCLISTYDNSAKSGMTQSHLVSNSLSVSPSVSNYSVCTSAPSSTSKSDNSSVFQVKYRPNINVSSPVIGVTSPSSLTVSPISTRPLNSSSHSHAQYRLDSAKTPKNSAQSDALRRNSNSMLSGESSSKVALSNISPSSLPGHGAKHCHFVSNSEFRYKSPLVLNECSGSVFSLLNGLLSTNTPQPKVISPIRNDAMNLRRRPRSTVLRNSSKLSDEDSGPDETQEIMGAEKCSSEVAGTNSSENFSFKSYIMWHTLLELRHRQSQTQYVRFPVATNSSLDVTGWRLLQCANNLDLPRSSEQHSSVCLKSLEGIMIDTISSLEQQSDEKDTSAKSNEAVDTDLEVDCKRPRLCDRQKVSVVSKLGSAIELVKGLQQRNKLLWENLGHLNEMSNELVKRHRFPALQLFDDLGRLISRASHAKHWDTFDMEEACAGVASSESGISNNLLSLDNHAQSEIGPPLAEPENRGTDMRKRPAFPDSTPVQHSKRTWKSSPAASLSVRR